MELTRRMRLMETMMLRPRKEEDLTPKETDQEVALVDKRSLLKGDLLAAMDEREASKLMGVCESANPLKSLSAVEQDLGSRKRSRTESIDPLPKPNSDPQHEPLKVTNSTSAFEGDHIQTIRELESVHFLKDFKRLDESDPQDIMDDAMTSLFKGMSEVSWAKDRVLKLQTLNDQHKKEITSLTEELQQKNEKDREREQTITKLQNQLAEKSKNLEDVESQLESHKKNLTLLKARQRTLEFHTVIKTAYELHEDFRQNRHHLWDTETVKSLYRGMKATEVEENTSSSAPGSQRTSGLAD